MVCQMYLSTVFSFFTDFLQFIISLFFSFFLSSHLPYGSETDTSIRLLCLLNFQLLLFFYRYADLSDCVFQILNCKSLSVGQLKMFT